MKKFLSLLGVAILGFSSVFAAYQPSPAFEDRVMSVGEALISIIDTQYNAQYTVLTDLLENYKTRYVGDDMRIWILNTLITQVEDHMAMIENGSDDLIGNIMDDLGGDDNDMDDDDMDDDDMDDDVNHVILDITGKNYAFSIEEIIVNEGDKVTIKFESTAGFHDWVVDEFDAATAQVTPGTITSVTFIADEEGTYEYYCSVGNHRAQGMVGTLIVLDDDMDDDDMDDDDNLENMIDDAEYLEHVAVGQTIRGISFDGSETGKAVTSTLVMESFPPQYSTTVYAEFENLPDAGEDNFYEGRAVRKSPFDFVSTGELEMEDGIYVNEWSASGDYSAYDHYVLTLEPRDNNPAPAEHIFEGDM